MMRKRLFPLRRDRDELLVEEEHGLDRSVCARERERERERENVLVQKYC